MRLGVVIYLLLFGFTLAQSQTIEQQAVQSAQRTIAGSSIRSVAPDPLQYLSTIDRRLRASGLAGGMLWLGGAVLFVGLIKRSYDITLSGNELEHPKLWLVAAIYASLLSVTLDAGGSFEIRRELQHLWQNAYAWSAERFDGDINQKVGEAQQALVTGASRVATAAGLVVGGYAGLTAYRAYSGFRTAAVADQLLLDGGGAAATSGVVGSVARGVSGLGTRALGGIASYLGLAQQFMYPLLSIYALGIMLSGLAVVMVCYLLPLAIGFLLWGYQNLVIGCVTVFLTALMTVVFLPPTMSLAIDVAFVESMQNVERITQNLDSQVSQAATLTQQVRAQLNGASQQQIESCLDALNTNQAALDQPVCQRQNTGNIFEQLGQQVAGVMRETWQSIEQNVLRPIRDVAILAVGSIVFLIIGLVLGAALLAQLPGLIGGILGGSIGAVTTAWQSSRINLLPGGRR